MVLLPLQMERKQKGVATPTGQNVLAAGDAIRVAYTALGAAGSSAVSILIER